MKHFGKYIITLAIIAVASITVYGQFALIEGKVINPKIKEVSLTKYDFVLQKDSIYYKAKIHSDSNFSIKIKIEKPSYFRLFNSLIWVTPNDKIFLVSDGFKETFEVKGKNNGNYIIINKIQLNIKNIRFSDYKNNLENYLNALKINYKEKLKYLDSIKHKFNITSEFEFFVKEDLRYEYLNLNLMIFYFQNQTNDDVHKLLIKHNIFNAIEFNDQAFVTNTYASFLNSYFINISLGYLNQNKNDTLNLIEIFRIIDKNFSNRSKEALKVMVLRDFALKESNKYREILNSLIVQSKNLSNYVEYSIALNEISDLINICNKPLSEDVLSSVIYNIDSTKYTFSSLMSLYKDKIVILDFWAMWCAPCIAEIPHLDKLYNTIDTNKVVILFLSKDRRFTIWKEYLLKEKLLYSRNHFFVGDSNVHPLVNSLSAHSIPRYVILNKMKNLAYYQAPRPSDGTKLLTLIQRIIDY